MNQEIISDKKAISIIILFLTGSTSIFIAGLDAKKDLWIAIILAIFMILPMTIIFARLHYIFPNKDLFDIIEICFGKFIGKGMIIIFTWYVFYWTADVITNYYLFIRTVSLTNTPKIISIIILALLCAWGIKEGIVVLGGWSEFFLIIVIMSVFFTIALLIPSMDINNIQPVLSNGVKPILKGAYSVFIIPFGQIVAFTMAFTNFKTKKSSYKVYIRGLLIAGIITFIISIMNILVLGIDDATIMYYPSYIAISRMNIGDILQRFEVIITIIFILGGFIKISILLLCTCKGFTKIFSYRDYQFIITPISLLVINLAYFQYDSIQHYFKFAKEIWNMYFLPFQLILPIIIWITAEIKNRRLANN